MFHISSPRDTRGHRGSSLGTSLLVLLLLFACSGSSPSTGKNAPPAGIVTEFPLPTANSYPLGIATGPDGNLWFIVADGNRIGRITPTGRITEFLLPAPGSFLFRITAGPDDNLWFIEADGNWIGRITPTGRITEFPLPTQRLFGGIAAGPDGNLWFTENYAIGRITPQGQIAEFPLLDSFVDTIPGPITAGPDGNLWFTGGSKMDFQIGRITPQGQITAFPLKYGEQRFSITAGPDGNLWFTQAITGIGRITPTGQITAFPLPTDKRTWAIAAGPDGNLWFTECAIDSNDRCADNSYAIGRITPQGQITAFPLPDHQSPTALTAGPDGALWFTVASSDKIGRISSGK